MSGKTASTSQSMDKNAAQATVTLPADCRMAGLGALAAELRAVLDASAALLDGRAVERVDTAALQLLLAFRREMAGRGHGAGWLGASNPLSDAAALLGLSRELDLPAPMPA